MNSTLPTWPPETSLPGGVDVAALALGSQRPFGLRTLPPHHRPGTPTHHDGDLDGSAGLEQGRGRPRRSPTDRLLRSPGEKQGEARGREGSYKPLPRPRVRRAGPAPAPAPAAPPPSPTPGFTLPAERGGARGAHWWVQKFKPNSTEPARRTRKGRRHPGAEEWAGGVRERMHSATGKRREAKGGDGSGRRVSEEGRQLKGGAAAEPWGRGSSRCPPGRRAPDPRPWTGGRPRWPSASSSRTAPSQDLPHDPAASTAGNPGARSSRS